MSKIEEFDESKQKRYEAWLKKTSKCNKCGSTHLLYLHDSQDGHLMFQCQNYHCYHIMFADEIIYESPEDTENEVKQTVQTSDMHKRGSVETKKKEDAQALSGVGA